MTPFVVAIVAYTFFGLDALGDEIEEPFGLESNDLPLDTLCRSIEISLRESFGETDLPEPLQPVEFPPDLKAHRPASVVPAGRCVRTTSGAGPRTRRPCAPPPRSRRQAHRYRGAARCLRW